MSTMKNVLPDLFNMCIPTKVDDITQVSLESHIFALGYEYVGHLPDIESYAGQFEKLKKKYAWSKDNTIAITQHFGYENCIYIAEMTKEDFYSGKFFIVYNDFCKEMESLCSTN